MTNIAVNFTPIESSQPPRWLSNFSKIVCALTGVLIFIGALVTSHDAGLSVPDWPTTYGQNMFTFPYGMWLGGIFYEHGHRLFASGVGFLILCLATLSYFHEPRARVRKLSYYALVGVILQGVLGGATVLLGLPDAVSVSHAVLGQSIFILIFSIAWTQSREFLDGRPITQAEANLSGLAIFTSLTVFLELVVGALMRHSASGLAVPDFPTMGGSYIPLMDETKLFLINEMRHGMNLPEVSFYQVFIHLLHRGVAILVVCSIFALLVKASILIKGQSLVKSGAKLLAVLSILQFTLGATTVLTMRAPYIASAHVFLGAITFGVCVLVALRASVKRPQS